MRRFIVFLLRLFLLPIASTASYKEEESTRAYADSIESLYDIKIIFDTECIDHQPSGDYSIITTPLHSSPLMSMLCAADYTLALETLSTVLSAYPDHYFSTFQCKASPSGLMIVIPFQVWDNNFGVVGGLYLSEGDGYSCIYLGADGLTPATIHHEIWQATEGRIRADNRKAFSGWSKLNPKGFKYKGDHYGDLVTPEKHADYFVYEYSKATDWEDRASVAEMWFSESETWWAEHPKIRIKLDRMKKEAWKVEGFRGLFEK